MNQDGLQDNARRKRVVLALVLISYLMGVLDVSIMITALPKILGEFGISPAQSTWVQNAYTLTYGGLILVGARAGDLFGRRAVYTAGVAIFTLASVWISIAGSMPSMVAGRALQGLGAAILTPATLALLTSTFEQGPERNRAVSYYGAMAGIGMSLGLVLGGFLADALSWRIGFFINLPIGIAMIWLAFRNVAETPRKESKLDIAGAILSALGATALAFGVESASHAGWSSPRVIVPITVGTSLLLTFIARQHRVANPILPLRLLAHRARFGAYLGRGLFVGGMMGFWFFMSMFLQKATGRGALETGLAFLPTSLVGLGSAFVAARITRRFGNAPVAAVGLIGALIGMLWLSRILPETEGIGFPMMLVGLGQGLSLGPLTGAAMVDVRPEEAGIGSGLVNVAQQMGGSFGLSILAVVFATTTGGIGSQISASMVGAATLLALALLSVFALVIPKKLPLISLFSLGARVRSLPE